MPATTSADGAATTIRLFSINTAPMRAFHLTWLAFFVCFVAWFAAAPLMPVIATQFHLTRLQVANINIAAVLVTVVGRMVVGPLCDRYGPRRTYVALLLLGALPVFGLALAQSYASLLFFRLLIGLIGASFVISQYHTSVMFAPNVVGTANATVGGWGNAGAGVAQALMPLLATLAVTLGIVGPASGWRVALVVPGFAMLAMAFVYGRYTEDQPPGAVLPPRVPGSGLAAVSRALSQWRVWLLAVCYGGCFGVEVFLHNIAASYFVARYGFGLQAAGLIAGLFGFLALFARPLGGILSDRFARRSGLDGRVWLLSAVLLGEGVGLLAFGTAGSATLAVATMLFFGVFLHMAAGAVYGLMPFVDRRAVGGVCGVIGAGGNAGAVLAALLNRAIPSTHACVEIIGIVVLALAVLTPLVRFPAAARARERALLDQALQRV